MAHDLCLVSHTVYGMQLQVGILGQLFPYALDGCIDHPGIPGKIESPDIVQQLFPCEDLAGMGCHQVKDLDLLGGEDHLFSVHRDLVAFKVDDRIALGDPVPVGFQVHLVEAAKDHLDPADDLPGRERLDDIIIGAQGKAQQLVHFLALGCQHDDGHVADRPDIRAQLGAAAPGHHDIKDDQVGRGLLKGLHDVASPEYGVHVIVLPCQVHPQ